MDPALLSPDALVPNPKRCTVWIHGPFTLMVQTMLGVISFITLVIKWRCERKRRSRTVFAFDAAKLGLSSGLGAHGLNIMCATLLADAAGGKDTDECSWYLFNHLLDGVVGVLLAGALVVLVEDRAWKWGRPALQRSGYYGDPPSAKVWVEQSVAWTAILLVSKVAILVPQLWYAPQLRPVAQGLVHPWIDHPKRELIFVMVVVPLLSSIVTIVVFDAILKAPPDDEQPGWRRGLATLRAWRPSSSAEWWRGGAEQQQRRGSSADAGSGI